jgi:hypothetical protein
MTKYTPPSRKDLGIQKTIDKHKDSNDGYGYELWRFARERGVNTSGLAKLFGVVWQTARDWETQDNEENGPPQKV